MLGAAYFGVKTLTDGMQEKVNSTKSQVTKIEGDIKKLEAEKPKEVKTEIDINQIIDEVAAIKKQGIDFAVIDGTVGFIDGDYRIFEHNNLNMVLEIAKSLNKYVKQFCINHMAMTLHTDHNTLENKMSEHNILVAYDGMEIEF